MKVSIIKNVVLGLAVALATSSAVAQVNVQFAAGGNASFSGVENPQAIIDSADASLSTAMAYDLSLTTLSDMLLVDATLTLNGGTTLVNDTATGLGSDVAAPAAALLVAFPGLNADSWITTNDGGTSAAGTNTIASGLMVTHFDTVDNGAISAPFQFARIVLAPGDEGRISATLAGTVQTAADPTPIFDDFSYTFGVPEPSSMGLIMSALLGGLAIIRRKRS